MEKKKERKTLEEPVSLEAQERLVEVMTDSPRIRSFNGTPWEVRALRPGTQWLVAQEALAVKKAENASFGDVVKEFAASVPSVVKCITLCLLNDRRRIYANGHSGEFSEEYNTVYETIMWDTPQKFWMTLLVEFLSMLDVEFFFMATASIETIRQSLLERKMTMDEQRQLSQEPNTVR